MCCFVPAKPLILLDFLTLLCCRVLPGISPYFRVSCAFWGCCGDGRTLDPVSKRSVLFEFNPLTAHHYTLALKIRPYLFAKPLIKSAGLPDIAGVESPLSKPVSARLNSELSTIARSFSVTALFSMSAR